MSHGQSGGLALKLGVGSPGLPKTSLSSEVKKLTLDGAGERMGSLASWQVLRREGREGQWVREEGVAVAGSLHAALVIYGGSRLGWLWALCWAQGSLVG